MKRVLLSFFMIFTVLSTMCVFAMDTTESENEVVKIENYDQIEDLLAGKELMSDEEKYEKQMNEFAKAYEESEVEELTKAKVIEASDSEDVYEEYSDGYLFKFKKQDIKVELLEGEYKGEIVSIVYPLTADMFLNLEIPELNVGDVIYVYPYLGADNTTVEAEVGNMGTGIERKTGVIILFVVTAILMIVFGKEKGVVSLLIVALIFVLTLLICSEQIYMGTQIILLSLLLATVIIFMMSISKAGLTKDALMISVISMLVLVFVVVLTYGVDALLKNTGATFDAMFLIETIVKRNIDFHDLFVGSIVLILAVALPNVVAKAWCKCQKADTNDINKLFDASRSAMSGSVEMVAVVLTTLIIPKLLYLYSPRLMSSYAYKYTTNEILNSDVLVTELIRLCMVLIGMALAVPMTVCAFKILKNFDEENKKVKDNK